MVFTASWRLHRVAVLTTVKPLSIDIQTARFRNNILCDKPLACWGSPRYTGVAQTPGFLAPNMKALFFHESSISTWAGYTVTFLLRPCGGCLNGALACFMSGSLMLP